jgi:hypothetical protein
VAWLDVSEETMSVRGDDALSESSAAAVSMLQQPEFA